MQNCTRLKQNASAPTPDQDKVSFVRVIMFDDNLAVALVFVIVITQSKHLNHDCVSQCSVGQLSRDQSVLCMTAISKLF